MCIRDRILESEVDLSTELDLKPPEFPPGRKGVIAQLNHGAKAFVQRIAPKPAARVKSFGRLSADLGPTVDLATFSVHNKQPLKQAAVEEADVRPSKRKKTQPGLLGRELDLSAGFSQHSKAHKAMIEMMAATLTAAPKCDPLPSKLVAAHAKGSEFLRHFWAAEIAGDQPRKWELLGAVKTLLGEVRGERAAPMKALCAQLEKALECVEVEEAGIEEIAARHVKNMQQKLGVIDVG
eukprot:TRINITY_DN18851_c0_g2_i1.p1 TRINITY_DN18851_c0_g2~~TRINITY_DN18851_c0_g2_i1.p1  ORF type:complete len:237 (+),score=70.58 TRINITY_DN18851_c0_g2_i1:101-811(+)